MNLQLENLEKTYMSSMFVISHSSQTLRSYKTAINRLRKFLKEIYQIDELDLHLRVKNKEIKKILKALKPESKTELVSARGGGAIDFNVGRTNFHLNYAFERGAVHILNITVDKDLCSLNLEVDCELPTDLILRLPRALIDAKTLKDDAAFSILADGEEISFIESNTTDNERWLKFPCIPNMENVEIIGTEILGITPGKKSSKEHTISLVIGSSTPVNKKMAEPKYLKISVGDTVTWENNDSAAHTITSGSTSEGPDGNFDSSLFMAGTKFSLTFPKAGKYTYFCMVHPWTNCVIEAV